MKTLKYSLLLFVFFVIVSCKKKSDYISAHVDLTVLTQDGRNTLSSPAIYDEKNIRVYHVINGQSQLYTDPIYNGGKPYMLLKDKGLPDKIRVFLYYDKDEPTSLTLIQFGDKKIDTIKGEFRYTESSVVCEQVWFNGVAKPHVFSITK